MASQGRQLGIDALGNIAWGTHLCIFYETPEDLPAILGLYFKAGLESNESCLWITSGPSESQEAMAALKSVVNDLDFYIRKGQIEILDASQWYTGSGQSQADKLLSGLIEKEQQAINRGFDGLRFSGNMFWLESSIWPHIIVEHEAIMSNIINGRRMIALCSYLITGCEAAKVLDIASSHQITLVKRAGRWTAIERSEHKRTEEALREGEERFRALVETTSDWIWEIDANGAYTYASPKIKELLGYEPQEVIGKTPFDFMLPEEARRVSSEIATILKSGSPFCGLENVNSHKDGHEVVLETSGVPIFDGRDNLRGYRGVDRDITERKRVEEALKQSEEKLRAMLDSVAEGIVVIDMEGNILETNEAAVRIYGGSKEELVGLNGFELVASRDFAQSLEDYNTIVREGHIGTRQYSFLRHDGTEYPGEVNVSLIRDVSGKPVGVICINRDITERKRMEDALRKSEAEYRLLVENANEAIVVICEDTLCYANPKTTEHTGYSKEELMSIPFINLIHPDDKETVLKNHARRLEGEPFPEGYSVRFIAKDGTTKWAETNAELVSWGDKPAVLVFATDVTERKKAEESLRKSEAEYRLLVETANEAVAVVCDGVICFVNRKATEMAGYSKDELTLKPFIDLIHLDDRQMAIERYEQTLREGRFPEVYPIRFIDKIGNTKWVEVNQVSILWEGRPATLNFVTDITEHKRMKEALQKSEAEYRLLVENANEAIVVACDGNLLFTNPKATKITGYPREELLSKPFVDLIHPDDRQMVLKRHLRRLSGEKSTDIYPIRVVDRDGNIKWVEINAALISWEDKPATLNFVYDITERRKAEEEAKRSRAELRRLSVHLQSVMEGERKRIAHEIHDELGQQLTALKMDLSWIGKNLPKNEKPLIEKIGAMSKYIDTTIDTVRKISTDLRPAILDDFGLLAAIESYLEEFQRRTGIKCTIAPRSGDVDLGQERNVALFRIVQEALTNVARHAHASNVEVSLKQRNGRILLQIKDDGRGVDEEEIASSKSIGIVGMRERARFCKGQMRIKSIVGKGTTVKVSIPLKKEKSSAEDISR